MKNSIITKNGIRINIYEKSIKLDIWAEPLYFEAPVSDKLLETLSIILDEVYDMGFRNCAGKVKQSFDDLLNGRIK